MSTSTPTGAAIQRPRQIVICCDGTSNTLTGGDEDTNVLRLHRHLASQPVPDGVERVLYYDPGVGSPGVLPPVGLAEWFSRSASQAAGLASGAGVFDNLAQAYLFLMRHWRDDADRIYLFGFSRGAFTVRALAGMVNLFGILPPQHEALVPTLVHIYFSPDAKGKGKGNSKDSDQAGPSPVTRQAPGTPESAADEEGPEPLLQRLHRRLWSNRRGRQGQAPKSRKLLAKDVQLLFCDPPRREVWIHWIGVWDTVESVGLPGPLSRFNPTSPKVLGKRYRHVRHLLSLDEHRWAFLPRLYKEPGDLDASDGRQTLRQRWLPGVHCDAGGSYPTADAGLSQLGLQWMVNEVATDLGVDRLSPTPADQARRHDPLWDTPWWALGGMALRDMHPRMKRSPSPFQAQVLPGLPSGLLPSVWEERRSLSTLAFWTVWAALCLLASGLCLSAASLWEPATWPAALAATREFAAQQTAALWGQGLLAQPPWASAHQPGWAMVWDLGFIVGWGYVVARVASRAFAWLAGARGPDSGLPWWRWLGFAPMVAVLGDVGEDAGLLASLALHGLGLDYLSRVWLVLGAACSLLKIAGLLACLPWLAVRLRLALLPAQAWRWPAPGAAPGAELAQRR